MEFRAQMLAEGGSPGPPCRGMPNRAAYLAFGSVFRIAVSACRPGDICSPLNSAPAIVSDSRNEVQGAAPETKICRMPTCGRWCALCGGHQLTTASPVAPCCLAGLPLDTNSPRTSHGWPSAVLRPDGAVRAHLGGHRRQAGLAHADQVRGDAGRRRALDAFGHVFLPTACPAPSRPRLSCMAAGPPATSAPSTAAPPPSPTRCPACSTCWWTMQASGVSRASVAECCDATPVSGGTCCCGAKSPFRCQHGPACPHLLAAGCTPRRMAWAAASL